MATSIMVRRTQAVSRGNPQPSASCCQTFHLQRQIKLQNQTLIDLNITDTKMLIPLSCEENEQGPVETQG